MGKWAARLAEKTPAPPQAGPAETDKRGLLAVLAVTSEGGDDVFLAAPMASIAQAAKPKSLDLAAVAWTDADIARFLDRQARLMRWGWTEPEADKLVERLVMRDREADERVICAECSHYRPGRCGNHRSALMTTADIGRDLAAMLQRCPGFKSNFPDVDKARRDQDHGHH